MKAKIALVFVLLFFPCMLAAQMPVSPTPFVTILPATPANLPQLDSATVEKFHPKAFILANNSDRAVVAISVQWTYTDSGGHPITNNSRSDSFMLVSNRAVILPHSRLLVGPGTFLSEALATEPHPGIPVEKLDGSRDREMSSGTDLAAKIDTIIFGDGEVVGPNSTHFDTEIQNRKMAATGLAKQLRNAMARGEDPKVTLNRIMESEPSRSDTLAFWQRRYARMMLLRFPRNFDGQLAATEKLPEPPNFFRK